MVGLSPTTCADEAFFQRGGALQGAGYARQDLGEVIGAEGENGEVGVVGGALIEGGGELLAVVDKLADEVEKRGHVAEQKHEG